MFFQKALIFLFSRKCLICGKIDVNIICKKCFDRINRQNHEQDNEVQKSQIIVLKNKNLDLLIYFFKYEKLIRKLMLEFKFFNKPYLSKVFAKIILKNEKICGKLKFYDIIVPVPMHKNKKKVRGYNQTELIACKIAEKLSIEYSKDTLIKIKNTKMQSALSGKERKQNIKSAFEITDFKKVKNKNVIIFDDIYTTGATLEECAKVLKNAGAKSVLGVVIAKD